MEGNGPLQGTPRDLGKIVLADDPVAADATCARLMGFDPRNVRHLSDGSRFLGNLRADRITMLAEPVETRIRPFAVLPEFRSIARGGTTAILHLQLERRYCPNAPLPVDNPTGEIERIRRATVQFCKIAGPPLAIAQAPKIIHSTIDRFRQVPANPERFSSAFREISSGLQFGCTTLNELLVALDTQPYMRQGRLMSAIALTSPG